MAGEHFTEKTFYLEEFRGHTLLVAVPGASLDSSDARQHLRALVQDLLPNDTRLLLLVGEGSPSEAEARRQFLVRELGTVAALRRAVALGAGPAARGEPPEVGAVLAGAPTTATLARIWEVLRRCPVFAGVVFAQDLSLPEYAQELAARLRVHKLVLVEEEGVIMCPPGRQLSFIDGSALDELLRPGRMEQAGIEHRRPTLEAIRCALHAGVPAVNLCALEGLQRELFTYEGSGTLFTLADYCQVTPLGIDDFEEVERLVERGQCEGFLKPRSAAETTQVVLHGYGARIGGNHLAGVCALLTEPYGAEEAGEIVALYTVTRFKGEGVGTKLMAAVERQARAQGLGYLFACTSARRAQSFFARCGFRQVPPAAVPAAKWEDYDPDRVQRVAVYRIDLLPEDARP